MKIRPIGMVLGFISGKGGVGKTSAIARFGAWLSRLGKKVLIINMDPLDNVSLYLGLENKHSMYIDDYPTVHDDPERIEKSNRIHSLSTQWKKGDAKLNVLTLRNSNSFRMENLSNELLKEVINTARGEFDYILVDAPAGIELGFIKTVMVSDILIGVVNNEVASISDLIKADVIVNKMNSENYNYVIDGIEYTANVKHKLCLLNRIGPDMTEDNLDFLLQEIQSKLSLSPIGYIVENKRVIGDNNAGITGTSSKRTSDVDMCYRRIAQRFMDISHTQEEKWDNMVSSWKETIEANHTLMKDTTKKGWLRKIFG